MEIITPREQIRKFFFEKHLEFLTSVPQQRLQEIILSSCMKGHSGKMVDYGECGPAHRTTYGHFLAKGKWDDKRLEETQKRESFQTVSELSRGDGTPLFISIDDTVLTYMVYRCEGPLNKIDHAVVLLSYPAAAMGRKCALRVFLYSDSTLSDEAILEYYSHRWTIEVLFRAHKRYMGLKSFMVRAAKALDRLLLVLALAHFFFSCGLGHIVPFHIGLHRCRSAFVIS